MGVMANGEFGRRLQAALGLGDCKVTDVQINANSGERVTATVKMILSGDHVEKTIAVLEAYAWAGQTYDDQEAIDMEAHPVEVSSDAQVDTTSQSGEAGSPADDATEARGQELL